MANDEKRQGTKKREERQLEVVLTSKEHEKLEAELREAYVTLDKLSAKESEAKEKHKTAKSALEEQEFNVKMLSRQVAMGTAKRSVQCKWVFHTDGMMHLYRLDDGTEVPGVDPRPPTPAEHREAVQVELPKEGADEGANAEAIAVPGFTIVARLTTHLTVCDDRAAMLDELVTALDVNRQALRRALSDAITDGWLKKLDDGRFQLTEQPKDEAAE
jgi:hypothetical protein